MAFTNEYKIDGDITTIYLKKRNGEVFETLIDTCKLQEIIKLGSTWHVRYNDHVDNHYAHATKHLGKIDGKYKNMSLHLHKVIMGIEPTRKILIDHKNNNTLDNRIDNLRLVNYIDNGTNRRGRNKNNKSGYRNVSKQGNKWVVQLQIDGKNTILGKFDDVHEAGAFAEEMRKKYYGEFAGEG